MLQLAENLPVTKGNPSATSSECDASGNMLCNNQKKAVCAREVGKKEIPLEKLSWGPLNPKEPLLTPKPETAMIGSWKSVLQ